MKTSLSNRKERLLKTEIIIFSLLFTGTVYALILRLTGFGIPCMFRLATGRLCPGCGMSHALMALLRGKLSQAFFCNHLSVTVVPVLLLIILRYAGRYVQSGRKEFTTGETVILSILLMISIAYGIVRNMP